MKNNKIYDKMDADDNVYDTFNDGDDYSTDEETVDEVNDSSSSEADNTFENNLSMQESDDFDAEYVPEDDVESSTSSSLEESSESDMEESPSLDENIDIEMDLLKERLITDLLKDSLHTAEDRRELYEEMKRVVAIEFFNCFQKWVAIRETDKGKELRRKLREKINFIRIYKVWAGDSSTQVPVFTVDAEENAEELEGVLTLEKLMDAISSKLSPEFAHPALAFIALLDVIEEKVLIKHRNVIANVLASANRVNTSDDESMSE